MPDKDPAEMVAVNRKRDSMRKKPWPEKQGPQKESPVLEPLSPDDAQPDN